MAELIEEAVELCYLAVCKPNKQDAGVRPLFPSWRYSLPFPRVTTSCRYSRPHLLAFSDHVSSVDVMPLVHCVDLAHSVFALLGNFGCSQLIEHSCILRVESLQQTMNSGLVLLADHGDLLY